MTIFPHDMVVELNDHESCYTVEAKAKYQDSCWKRQNKPFDLSMEDARLTVPSIEAAVSKL